MSTFIIGVGAALVASFVWARVATWLALLGWSALGDAHWTERARIAWPVVVDRLFLVVGLPAVACLCATLAGLDTTSQLAIAGAAGLGAVLGTRDGTRRIFPSVTFGVAARSRMVRVLALVPIGVAGLAALITPAAPRPAITVAVALFLLGLLWSSRLHDLLVHTGLAEDAPERVRRIIARLQPTCPRVAVIATGAPNAWAFPLTNELLIGDSLLASLDDDELAAILAHELGHLAEPRWAKTTRAVLGHFWLPLPFMPLFVVHDLAWLGVSLVALPLLVSTFVTRRLEADADAWAAARIPPPHLARALEKVHAASYIPAVMTLSTTHPSLWSRMHAAGVAPEWPRPEPPRRGIGRLSVLVALASTIAALATIQP